MNNKDMKILLYSIFKKKLFIFVIINNYGSFNNKSNSLQSRP